MTEQPESEASPQSLLEITRQGTAERRYHPLVGSHYVIGRSPEVAIILDHWSVSRTHAALERGPSGGWWLRDLGSTNGTFVNGIRTGERLLSLGDGIQIGDFLLLLRSSTATSFPSPISSHCASPLPFEGADSSPPETQKLDTAAPSTRRGAPGIGAEHLASTLAFGRCLMGHESPAKRLSCLCDFVIGEDFPATAAAVFRLNAELRPIFLTTPVARDRSSPAIEISPDAIASLWEKRQAVLFGGAQRKPGRTRGTTQRAVSIGGIPLARGTDHVDVLYVEFPPLYGTPDWLNLVALAAEAFQQAELVWEMRTQVRQTAIIEGELETARQIQKGLLPDCFLLDGLEIAVGFEPCRWVGGDYVDAFQLPDGRVLLAIADVCGKGIQAALVASSLHTLVRVAADAGHTLPHLLRRINDHLLGYLPEHSFVTMFCVAIDCTSGDLEFVSAGHPAAFIARASGVSNTLEQGENVGLGLMRTDFESRRDNIGVGDTLLLYTDGLSELLNEAGEPFGVERVGAEFGNIVMLNPSASVDSMRQHLLKICHEYRGTGVVSDDTAFLVVARRYGTMRPPPPIPDHGNKRNA